MVRKRFILPVIGAAVFGTTIFGATIVGAQETINPTYSLAQKIAQRFNLNQSDVQKVFDEQRAEHYAQMEKELEDRLNLAIKDKKITEAQKQAILTKVQEMHNSRESNFKNFKNMTEEERRTVMEAKRTELATWASQQGLSLSTVQELIGHKGGFKMKGFGGRGMMHSTESPAGSSN